MGMDAVIFVGDASATWSAIIFYFCRRRESGRVTFSQSRGRILSQQKFSVVDLWIRLRPLVLSTISTSLTDMHQLDDNARGAKITFMPISSRPLDLFPFIITLLVVFMIVCPSLPYDLFLNNYYDQWQFLTLLNSGTSWIYFALVKSVVLLCIFRLAFSFLFSISAFIVPPIPLTCLSHSSVVRHCFIGE